MARGTIKVQGTFGMEEHLAPDPACFHERCEDTDHTCKKCRGYIGCGCGRCERYVMREKALAAGAGD